MNWEGFGGTETTIAGWKTRSSAETNSTECNAVFVDAASNDYHIDSGSDTCAYQEGEDLSARFSLDIDSEMRTTPWTRGADG